MDCFKRALEITAPLDQTFPGGTQAPVRARLGPDQPGARRARQAPQLHCLKNRKALPNTKIQKSPQPFSPNPSNYAARCSKSRSIAVRRVAAEWYNGRGP
jgi:hypothetical protein